MAPAKIVDSKFFPHKAQQIILNSAARFNIVFAGRRFGKSVLAVNLCIENAIAKPNSRIWYCSPLYKQTKEIAWNLFTEYCPKELITKKNEADLKITLGNGSEISLKGTDNADSLVGVGLNFCVLDEFPLMKQDVWYHIVRPMMIDTKGECLFIGTPRGFNWAYDLWRKSEKDNDFTSFHFKTIDNTAIDGITSEVSKAKLEATSELDKIIYRQEYEATFEVITGRPRFDLDILTKLYECSLNEPIKTDGFLNLYEEIDPLTKYVIGVDTSEGLVTGDNSSAVILNAKDYSVAAHYSGKIPPDLFAIYLRDWANQFNEALIVCEVNNHGLVTLTALRDIYSNIYYRKHFDETANIWTKKIGFQTSSKTKPLLISNLDKAIRSGLKITTKHILDEMRTYIVLDDGQTEASEGSHDDSVIASALAIQGYLELYEFKKEKEKDKPVPYSIDAYTRRDELIKQQKEERKGIW